MHLALLNLALVLLPVAPPSDGETAAAATEDLFAFYSAGFDEVLSDPRDSGLLGWLENLEPMLELIATKSGEPLPPQAVMFSRWITRPFCVRGNVDDEGRPHFQFDISWDDRAVARTEFAQFRKGLAQMGIELNASDADAGSMITWIPAGKISAKLVDSDEGSILSLTIGRRRAPAFQLPDAPLPGGVEPAFSATWDGRMLSTILEKNLSDANGKKLRTLLNKIGLAGPDALRVSIAMGHSEAESITTTHVKGWADSFFGKGLTQRLSRADLALLPVDTLWSWLGNVNPSQLFELAREIDKPEVNKFLGMASQMFGVNLERDFFNRIGPLVGAYSSRSTGGSGGPTGLVFFAQCDQPQVVVESLEKILSTSESQMHMQISSSDWKHGEYNCTSFSAPGSPLPIEPCLAIAGDKLFIAASRSGLVEALDQLDRDESVLDSPRIAALPPAALENLLTFGFYDAAYGLERGYSTIGMLQSSLRNMMAGANGDSAASAFPNLANLIPPYSQLKRGSRPTVTLTYVKNGDLLQATTHDSSTLARLTSGAGSPMSMGGPASMSIIASLAIPNLMGARLAGNESAAIASMRTIAVGQAQLRASGAIDTDADGAGEYGTLGELSASRMLRGQEQYLEPAFLSSEYGELKADGCRGTVAIKHGYYFQVWVPSPDGSMVCDQPEGTNSSLWRADADAAEDRWCAYAWPVKSGSSGNRSFFTDHRGDIYSTTTNGSAPYGGSCEDGGKQPAFNAAYAHGAGAHSPAYGMESSDGNVWQIVN